MFDRFNCILSAFAKYAVTLSSRNIIMPTEHISVLRFLNLKRLFLVDVVGANRWRSAWQWSITLCNGRHKQCDNKVRWSEDNGTPAIRRYHNVLVFISHSGIQLVCVCALSIFYKAAISWLSSIDENNCVRGVKLAGVGGRTCAAHRVSCYANAA